MGRDVVRDPIAASRAAVEDARSRSDLPPRLCVAMTTVGQVEASVILDALRVALGPDVPILGGGASPRDPADDPRNGNDAGREIAGDVVTDDAIAILLFCGPLAMSYGVDTGWRGVGPMATVTGVTADSVVDDRRQAGARVLREVPRHGHASDRQSPRRVRCPRRAPVLPPHARSRTTRRRAA